MRFFGEIGFVSTKETEPGIWEPVVEERPYYGNVVQNNRRWTSGESVNDNLVLNNSISVVLDDYLNDNFPAIRYVKWKGAAWKVTSVAIERPRLTLTLGEVYNGDTLGVPSAPEGSDGTGELVLPTP